MDTLQLAPTEVGTVYEVILAGDSDATRRGDRFPVIISNCEYLFHDDASLEACIMMLRESDARLAAQPNRQYDWNQTMVTRFADGGGCIKFSVSWYDEAFFQERREVFMGGMHQRLYDNLGISDADIAVTHWRRA
jgi:hypothetical protein